MNNFAHYWRESIRDINVNKFFKERFIAPNSYEYDFDTGIDTNSNHSDNA